MTTFSCVLLFLFAVLHIIHTFAVETVLEQVLNVDPFISIVVYANPVSSNITMTGPSNYWFGIGFNGTSMADTYTIIVNGSDQHNNLTEFRLGESSAGMLLPNILRVLSNTVSDDNIRTLQISRATVLASALYFSFPLSNAASPMIWAYGETPNTALQYHTITHRGVALDARFYDRNSTTFAPTRAPVRLPSHPPTYEPSPAPTRRPTANYDEWDLKGQDSTRSLSGVDFHLRVGVNISAQELFFHIIGPLHQWFGIGFGSATMANTYALILNEGSAELGRTDVERILAAYTKGAALSTPTVTLAHDYMVGNTRDVMYKRPLFATNVNATELVHVNRPFSACNFSLSLIWAFGSNLTFGYHGAAKRASTIKVVGDTTCSDLPQAPTPAPTEKSDAQSVFLKFSATDILWRHLFVVITIVFSVLFCEI